MAESVFIKRGGYRRMDTFMLANIIHNFSRTVAQNRAKFAKWLESDDPTVVANALIRLCDRADFLTRKQLDAQGERFLDEGGFKERLTRVRTAARVEPESPACPKCGEPMRLRSARKGPRAGGKFWGCTNYPECDGLLDVEGDEKRRQSTGVDSSRLASEQGEVKQ